MIVFDKAYNFYSQFAQWTREDIFFVSRLKNNAKYEVVETFFEQELSDNQSGVTKVEHIHLRYKAEKTPKTLCLRKVTYRDEKNRIYQFMTNNWTISAEEVALIYKYRWSIELVFKKLKQNFQLHFFFRKRKRHKNASLGNAHCTFIADRLDAENRNRQSIFDRCGTDSDTFYE